MKKQIKNLFFLTLILVLFLFILPAKSRAAGLGTVCEKSGNNITIKLKLAYWTTGISSVPNWEDIVQNDWKNDIETVWNKIGKTTACNFSVKVEVESKILTGCLTEADCCRQAYQQGFHCIRVLNTQAEAQALCGSGGGACVAVCSPDVVSPTKCNPTKGNWWIGSLETPAPPSTMIDVQTACPPTANTYGVSNLIRHTPAHESGHLMGLWDEYCPNGAFNCPASVEKVIMGLDASGSYMDGSPFSYDATQYQLDRIVEKQCSTSANFVCFPSITTPICSANICEINNLCGDSCPGSTCKDDCTCETPATPTPSSTPPTSSPSPAATPSPSGPVVGGGGGLLDSITCIRTGNCTICDLVQIVVNFGMFLLGIVGAVTLLFFVYGGFLMLVSGGKMDMVDKGKKILINSVIGLTLVLFAYSGTAFIVNIVSGGKWGLTKWREALKCPAAVAPVVPSGPTPGGTPSGSPSPSPSPGGSPTPSPSPGGSPSSSPSP